MPGAKEALATQSQQEAALNAATQELSAVQEVAFRRYQRVVLTSDGSVFWVGTDSKATFRGSLHYATDRYQDEDQTIGANQFLFTSQTEITQFNALSPSTMWIGTWEIPDSNPLRIAFSSRGNFFRESDQWHYSGFAIFPALQTQIIEDATDIPAGPIVSNSLPFWLTQNSFAGQTVEVYPSFLVPDNLTPPYIVAHIAPEGTQCLNAFPIIGPWPGNVPPSTDGSPLHVLAASQQYRDEVTLTLYGFDNQMAWQYLVQLIENSMNDPSLPGFANSPSIVDEKRTQVELATLAQKKSIHISANYYQGAADAIARRLILQASVTYQIEGGFVPEGPAATTQDDQTVDAEGEVFE